MKESQYVDYSFSCLSFPSVFTVCDAAIWVSLIFAICKHFPRLQLSCSTQCSTSKRSWVRGEGFAASEGSLEPVRCLGKSFWGVLHLAGPQPVCFAVSRGSRSQSSSGRTDVAFGERAMTRTSAVLPLLPEPDSGPTVTVNRVWTHPQLHQAMEAKLCFPDTLPQPTPLHWGHSLSPVLCTRASSWQNRPMAAPLPWQALSQVREQAWVSCRAHLHLLSLSWILGEICLMKGLSGIGTGCAGKWLSHHPRGLQELCRCRT